MEYGVICLANAKEHDLLGIVASALRQCTNGLILLEHVLYIILPKIDRQLFCSASDLMRLYLFNAVGVLMPIRSTTLGLASETYTDTSQILWDVDINHVHAVFYGPRNIVLEHIGLGAIST